MRIRRDVERVSAPLELSRCLFSMLLLIVGVWLTFSTYERPFLMVSAIEPAGKTARPRANAQSLLGPQAEEISAARERKIPLVTVGGDEWTAFFDKVSQSIARGLPVPEWGENIVGYDRREIARAGKAHLRTLYFALDEEPRSARRRDGALEGAGQGGHPRPVRDLPAPAFGSVNG